MKKEEFLKRLDSSIEKTINFARTLVSDIIPDEKIFNLYCYSSSMHPDKEDLKSRHLRLSRDEVIDVLFKDEAVPCWINVFVSKIDKDVAIISLKYSDTFSKDNGELDFYNIEDTAPFKIGGPYHVGDFKDGEKYKIEEFNEDTGELK